MTLDDLIAQVQQVALSDDPLDRLSAAMDVKGELDDVGDSLLGHFVDQARRAGRSWAEIGSAMGVSKQAAQQRHTAERQPPRERAPWHFGRWTDRAKSVLGEANGVAVELGHTYVGTEHLLLGLLAVPQGIAGRLLTAAGVTRDAVLAKAEPPRPPAGRTHRTRLPFTPKSEHALAAALKDALELGHNYIGTEHLLLGLFDVDGIGTQVVTDAGMTKAGVRSQVIEILKGVA